MNSFVNDYPARLLDAHEPPCLSLCQPTHRHHPHNQQDPIRFRNLVKAMAESLRQKYATRDVSPLLEPFEALTDDYHFWNHTLDGLAVLAAPGMFRVYRLQRPVPELVVVADTFHLKPLMRILQSADRYQILGLSRGAITLFEGNRDALDQLDLAPGVPRTITEALGEELTEPHLTVASYGTGTGGPAMYHGHGSRKEEIDRDAERFFRVVDRAIVEHHSRPSGLPLLLAALPEHHSLFRQVSHNPFLMAEGLEIYLDVLPLDALRDRAWRVVEPQYLARLVGLVEAFGETRFKGRGTDELSQVAEAAMAGRVATLLIEAERQVPGRMDAATGQIVVVPSERVPTPTGLAAIYRF